MNLYPLSRRWTGALALAVLLLGLLQQDPAAAREIKRAQEVFRYAAEIEAGAVLVRWDIEPGYYMYRDKMGFAAAGFELGQPRYPAGEIHSDEFFGEQIIFRDSAVIRIPLLNAPADSRSMTLEVRSQGCADFGLCYPPQQWFTTVAVPATALAAPSGRSPFGATGAGDDEPLAPEAAFVPEVTAIDPFTLEVNWEIAPGYYLYRKDFAVSSADNSLQFGALTLPPGLIEDDLEFGATEVYYDRVSFRAPFSRASREAQTVTVTLAYQGCKAGSICYPPATVQLTVDIPAASASDMPALPPVSEQDRLFGVIANSTLPTMMLVFLGLGLLLAFTPCCLPMVPILSGIIAGQGPNVTTARSFWLSLSYVLGMAFTYTLAGALFGAAGSQIQATLQTPLVLGGVATLFVVLALAMFGVYELQLPAALQTRLTALGSKGKAGSFLGTAVMGAISALVVSACVAPPLVAALAVIAQTGDVARGATALFALSMGMGIPLLIFGTSAGKLLPKSGAWMNTVKGVFGVMLLGLAIWMLDRVLPGVVTMLLWSALAVFTGIWLGVFTRNNGNAAPAQLAGKGIGVLALVYGAVLLVGALSGSTNPLQPLDRLVAGGNPSERHLNFERIKTVEEFEVRRLATAANGQTLMLDFYADWCVSCKEMEAWTFTNPEVQAALRDTVLIQADVTANDAADQALLQHFGIFGPPTIVFFDRNGDEVQGQRVIGYMRTAPFLTHLGYVLR